MPKNPLTLSRQELYAIVWARPMVEVAKEFSLSDVGLAKRCRAVGVPVPPRGYWARVAAGQSPARTPLPKYRTREPTKPEEPKPQRQPAKEVVREAPEPVAHFEPRAPKQESTFRLPEDDIWLAERRAFDADPAHVVVFDPAPNRWHKVLIPHRDKLRLAAKELGKARAACERYDELPEHRRQGNHDLYSAGYAWRRALHTGQRLIDSHKAIPFRVSLGCFERSLAIVNSLAKAVEHRGFVVEDDPSIGRLVVVGQGGRVPFRVTERLEEKIEKRRRYDGTFEPEKQRLPTGILKLSVEITAWNTIDFVDRPGKPVEQQLPKVLEAVYKIVIKDRVDAREAEQRRLERVAADEARARADEMRRAEVRRREAEAQRRRELVAEASQWRQAASIRAYVRHVRQMAGREDEGSRMLDDWRRWALEVAEEMDPTRARMAEASGGPNTPDVAGESSD